MTNISFGWYTPPHAQTEWLERVRSLRAMELYDGGRRPKFRDARGAWVDDDPIDEEAHHLVARRTGELLGVVRLIPSFGRAAETPLARLLRPEFVNELVHRLGGNRARIAEVGRLVASATGRKSGVGAWLVAGVWALAWQLGAEHILAAAGTRDGQTEMLVRSGGKVVSERPITMPEYADEVSVLHFDLAKPAPEFARLVNRMGVRLGLSAYVNPRRSSLARSA